VTDLADSGRTGRQSTVTATVTATESSSLPMQTIDETDGRPQLPPDPVPGRTPRTGAVADPLPPPDPTISRLSYLVGSAVVALGVAVGLNKAFFTGRPLDVSTDVVGYPAYSGYNPDHYSQMFLLAVVVFPVVLGVTYFAFDRIVPRLVVRMPAAPVVAASGVAGRIAVPGLAFGAAAAIADHAAGTGVAAWLAAGVAASAAGVVAVSLVLGLVRPKMPWGRRLAVVNALVTPATLLGVLAVSAANEVLVRDIGAVDPHPFLPWPLAVGGVVVVAAIVAVRLRRMAGCPLEDLRAFEYSTVALVAGSALVFMVTSNVPGALGRFDAFHEGEGLGTVSLLRRGYFPWRDVLFIHGPLNDGLWPWLSLNVVDNSRWGLAAGPAMIILPLGFVSLWVLAVRVTMRNWVVLVGLAGVMLAGNLFFGGVIPASISPRWPLLPPAILALGSTLRTGSRLMAAGLGALLVLAFVLTPEFSFAALSLVLALVGYEAVDGRGTPWLRRFSRTAWCAVGGTAAAGLFVAWLAVNGAVDDFVFYFRTFAPQHALTGAYRVSFAEADVGWWFVVLLPFALAALTAAFVVWRIAQRSNPRPYDWAMGSLALLGLLFYPKGLIRPDLAHLLATLYFGIPLLVYVVARVLEPGDRRIATLVPGRAPRQLFSAVVLGALLATAVPAAADRLSSLPQSFTPDVPSAPSDPKVGYAEAGGLSPTVVPDLEAALAAVGPGTRVFDFSNQPAIVYFLMGLPSPTRYFHVSMAMPEPNQRDLVEQLAQDPPEVVLYWGNYGMSQWDGIVNPVRHYDVSQWVLEHYRPWVALDHQVLYLRNDIEQPPADQLAPDVSAEPVTGDGLIFELPACDWGLAPAFLDVADRAEPEGETLVGEPVEQIVAYTGHAGPVAGMAPAWVLAVGPDGRVLSESPVAAGGPAADGFVAFSTQVGLAAGERPEDVGIVAVAADGTAVPVGTGSAPAPGTRLPYSAGRDARVVAPDLSAAAGTVTVAPVDWPGAYRIDRLSLPPGASESADWLQLDADGTLPAGSFTLTPALDGGPSRAIQFRTTGRPIDPYLVQVASCPQWQTSLAPTMYLSHDAGVPVRASLHDSVAPLVAASR
jgi:hypothetical protein